MKNKLLYGWLTIFFVGIIFAAQSNPDVLDLLLTPDFQKQCGLHKINAQERESLCQVLLSLLRSSELIESAKLYLENEGWEEVTVLGTYNLKLNDYGSAQDYTIAEKGAWTYILEPKTYSYLEPGKNLGQMNNRGRLPILY
jgi:hypothetical protein